MAAKTSRKSNIATKLQVLNILTKRIAEGDYLPGTKLIEKDMADEFHISRQMARDVLQELECRGLVEKEPNKGAVVRRISFEALFQLMEVREVIEGLAARLAALNSEPEDWQDLIEEFGRPMEDTVRGQDFDTYLSMVNKFQARLLKCAKNDELSLFADRIYTKMLLIQRRLIILPGRLEAGLKEHREVMQAIIEKDGEKAEMLKKKNLRSAMNFLRKYKKWVL